VEQALELSVRVNSTMEEFQDKSDLLKTRKDILWGMYQEHRTHARHNETLRSTVSNILIVASAGLVSLSTYDQKINREDLSAAILLIGFGVLGIMFSAAYTERYHRNRERANAYRTRLDELFFKNPESSESDTLEGLTNKADRTVKFRKIAAIIRMTSSSHLLWVALPCFISIIGVFLTIKALSNSVIE
jgi:hypothetical protein